MFSYIKTGFGSYILLKFAYLTDFSELTEFFFYFVFLELWESWFCMKILAGTFFYPSHSFVKLFPKIWLLFLACDDDPDSELKDSAVLSNLGFININIWLLVLLIIFWSNSYLFLRIFWPRLFCVCFWFTMCPLSFPISIFRNFFSCFSFSVIFIFLPDWNVEKSDFWLFEFSLNFTFWPFLLFLGRSSSGLHWLAYWFNCGFGLRFCVDAIFGRLEFLLSLLLWSKSDSGNPMLRSPFTLSIFLVFAYMEVDLYLLFCFIRKAPFFCIVVVYIYGKNSFTSLLKFG